MSMGKALLCGLVAMVGLAIAVVIAAPQVEKMGRGRQPVVRSVEANRLLSISGYVLDCDEAPIPYVTIVAVGFYPVDGVDHPVPWEYQTNSGGDGFYEVLVPWGWSGWVVPYHPDYDFVDGRGQTVEQTCTGGI